MRKYPRYTHAEIVSQIRKRIQRLDPVSRRVQAGEGVDEVGAEVGIDVVDAEGGGGGAVAGPPREVAHDLIFVDGKFD